jgi:hypothetical protein
MIHLLRVIQILFSVSLVGGFWLWWMLDHVGHGYPPEAASYGGGTNWMGNRSSIYSLSSRPTHSIGG